MPEIQQYSPETEASGPVGGLDPRVEAATLQGRAVENFGSSLESVGNGLYRRQEQRERADAYTTFATARNEWFQKIKDQAGDGSLDTEAFQDDWQDFVDKNRQNFTTAQGTDAYDRMASRTGAYLMQRAAMASTQIAAAHASASYIQAENADANQIVADPSAFDHILDSRMKMIDDNTGSADIPANKAPMLKLKTAQRMAIARVQGLANQNPDLAEKDIDSGKYDDYFNPEQQQKLYQIVNTQRRINAASANQADKEEQRKYNDYYQEVGGQWLGLIQKDALSPKTVLADPTLSVADKEHFLAKIEEHAKQGGIPSNPRLTNMIVNKIKDGEITDMGTVMKTYGKSLALSDLGEINKAIGYESKTPEAKEFNDARNQLLKSAEKTLRFKNLTTGAYDIQGEKNLAQFRSGLNKAIDDAKARGDDPMELFDPTSKNYYGNQLSKYPTGLNATLQGANEQAVQDAQSRMKTAPDVPSTARKPGESIQDWKLRTKFKPKGP